MISVSDFNYHLPPKNIANLPADPRDSSHLMLVNRSTQEISHTIFHSITDQLSKNDVLVLNETKVFPARLFGHKRGGDPTEVILIKPLGNDQWECMGRRFKVGSTIDFDKQFWGTILSKDKEAGTAIINFTLPAKFSLESLIDQQGHTPIPPYIQNTMDESELRSRYQTTYANHKGSVAAPTAGLHFTRELLNEIEAKGIRIEKITLHVGPGTFGTIYSHHIASKKLHTEKFELSQETHTRLQNAKNQGKRIIAVGTTTCRALESLFGKHPYPTTTSNNNMFGQTDLFIMPPHQFNFVDALLTNFHLPESSLLMLVTAFVSSPNTDIPYASFQKSLMGKAYQTAIQENYRFFSFGDAMFIY